MPLFCAFKKISFLKMIFLCYLLYFLELSTYSLAVLGYRMHFVLCIIALKMPTYKIQKNVMG